MKNSKLLKEIFFGTNALKDAGKAVMLSPVACVPIMAITGLINSFDIEKIGVGGKLLAHPAVVEMIQRSSDTGISKSPENSLVTHTPKYNP